jgi:paraquat-inducible protein A
MAIASDLARAGLTGGADATGTGPTATEAGGASGGASGGSLASCRSCDLRQSYGPLPPGAAAQCRRCGDVLFRRPRVGLDVALALALTALFLFLLANAYPLVTFELAGRSQSGRLVSGVVGLYQEGYWELAALVGFTTIVAPLLYLLGLLYVLIPLTLGRRYRAMAPVFRAVVALAPWAMMEVYTLGILVALIKLGDFGQVVPGVALYAFFCLTFAVAATNAHLDREAIWERLAEAPVPKARADADVGGLWACAVCDLLVRPLGEDEAGACPRCGAALRRRKANSLARTWALLISGYVLYVPANLFPVMVIVSFGKQETSTIFAGVVELAQGGMLPIAILVFCASIAIPILKLVSLTVVAASVQFRWRWRPAARTRLYRLVEGIGRWSMIDVFVISILVALIQLERVATIEPSLGAFCFAAVVILTMFAAMSFDPRLIWDRWEEKK